MNFISAHIDFILNLECLFGEKEKNVFLTNEIRSECFIRRYKNIQRITRMKFEISFLFNILEDFFVVFSVFSGILIFCIDS